MTAPLGPLTVAALLPDDWDIKFVDLNIREVTEDEWGWSDMIMLSGMIAQRPGLLKVIEKAKQTSKITVAGGPYPTLMPGELLEAGCDYVVRGEAETTIQLLLHAIRSGQTGQILETTERADLSTTPLPRYDLICIDDYLQFLIQTTRGCPFACEFCNISGLYGKEPRYKSPDQVISEIEHLYHLGVREHLFIADDNFIANKKNAQTICHRLIEWNRQHGEPFGFTTQASANLGQDLEMIDLMTAANFGDVFIGIETPDKDILAANEKYQNIAHPLLESIDTITRNGLSVIGSFIIGFDNEKKGAGKRICDFVDKSHIPIVMPNVLSAPPASKLWERLIKEGRCHEEDLQSVSGDSTLCLPNFTPTRPLEEIMEEYVEMWEYLYEPCRFLERTYSYCLTIRPTRQAMAASNSRMPTPGRNIPKKFPTRGQLRNLAVFLGHVWTHGITSSHKMQFWKQLRGMQLHNPSRLKKYIIHCIYGESHIRMSRTIRQSINQLLAEREKTGAITLGRSSEQP